MSVFLSTTLLVLLTLTLATVGIAAATKATTTTTPTIVAHLVSHTHLDVLWLKTHDQVAYGLNNTIQPGWTNDIIDSVVSNLAADPSRKFTYVEIAFMYEWWQTQNEAMKATVRRLVSNGQLTFANGGYCMPDEANVMPSDFLDTITLGNRWLQRELNVSHVSQYWSIDPFGHSATINGLVAMAGFESTHFARIDFRDYAFRAANKQREFMWAPIKSLPHVKLLADSLVDQTYGPPNGFDWGVVRDLLAIVGNPIIQDDFIVDQPESTQFNVREIVEKFIKVAKHYADVTAQDTTTGETHILLPMGSDLEYMMGSSWYTNLDKLIKYVNLLGGPSGVSAKYSTVEEYSRAKLKMASQLPTYNNADFFPYADGENAMWSGYFTSRPSLKRMIRRWSSYYGQSRQIRLMCGLPTSEMPYLARAMGLATHHDSVTGTAKQHATFDLQKRMYRGYVTDFYGIAQSNVWTNTPGSEGETLVHCPRMNLSECSGTASLRPGFGNRPVVVWNPSPFPRQIYIQIPVPYSTVSAAGGMVSSWSNTYKAPRPINDYGDTVNPNALPFELSVQIKLPAAGYAMLYLDAGSNSSSHQVEHQQHQQHRPLHAAAHHHRQQSQLLHFDNGIIQLAFDNNTGLLTSVRDMITGTVVAVEQSWCTFASYQATLHEHQQEQRRFKSPARARTANTEPLTGQNGGAYIMRLQPHATCQPVALNASNGNSNNNGRVASLTIISEHKGFVVLEQDFGWISQRIVLAENEDWFSIDFTVTGVPIADGFGKEVFARFRTNRASSSSSSQQQQQQEFYTDSNHREFLYRKTNSRPSWPGPYVPSPAGNGDEVAGNMYPAQAIFVNSSGASTGFGVATDAPMAAGMSGSDILIDVHRRLLVDDMRGVFEFLNETARVEPYPDIGCYVPFNPFGCGRHVGAPMNVRGRLRVTIGGAKSIVRRVRSAMEASVSVPEVFFFGEPWWTEDNNKQKKSKKNKKNSKGSNEAAAKLTYFNASGSLLTMPLDTQLQLMTVQLIEPTLLLVRISHRFAVDEEIDNTGTAAYAVKVRLSTLFGPLAFHRIGGIGNGGASVTSVNEVSLTTTRVLQSNVDIVEIAPMEVRAFEFNLKLN